MNDETAIISKPADTPVTAVTKTETTTQGPVLPDSQIGSVSVRAWIALLVALTICVMSVMGKEVIEPLYGLGYLAFGFFFGQAKSQKTV